uniref:ATPase family AAA domain-containing protein 1 n=1 Tax=Cacopsylla melanoneura TaxID=428564 RepID=A0A8D9BT92_9HEMI
MSGGEDGWFISPYMIFGTISVSVGVYFGLHHKLKDFIENNCHHLYGKQPVAYTKLEKLNIEIKLDKYEKRIATNLIVPEDIKASWKDIAGLDHVKKDLYQTVIFPMKHKDVLKESKLLKPPKGILMYGPPGCGKTLIAKATAKEADVNFINLDISTVMDKWYGEGGKLATAIFSLAAKIQPCIIFIDEIDSLLRTRSSSDHEATSQLKAIFLSKWDGLETDKDCDIVVMGATNRPDDIDAAIRRRMPKTIHINNPDKEQRCAIIKLLLSNEEHDLDDRQMDKLTDYTDGFSSNDLTELCRDAAAVRLEEMIPENINDLNYKEPMKFRKMTMMNCLRVAVKHIILSTNY